MLVWTVRQEWVSLVDVTGSVQNTPSVNHCWSFYDIEVGGVVKYLLCHRIQSQLNIGTTVTAVGFLVVKQNHILWNFKQGRFQHTLIILYKQV